jgi:hypothetical protein
MMLDGRQSKRQLVAFHGDPAVKAFHLDRLRSHVHKDEIVQGVPEWKDGKGGVIGCTVHGHDRRRYELDLGIPAEVASLEEIIFERLPEEEAKRFCLEFLEAVPVGIIRFARTADTRAAIEMVAGLYARMLRGEPVSLEQFRNAVQIAGPLGEGVAAQVVSGAAEAMSDTIQITAWTVARACLVAPEEMWPAIKSKLLDLLRSARAYPLAFPRRTRLAAAG